MAIHQNTECRSSNERRLSVTNTFQLFSSIRRFHFIAKFIRIFTPINSLEFWQRKDMFFDSVKDFRILYCKKPKTITLMIGTQIRAT